MRIQIGSLNRSQFVTGSNFDMPNWHLKTSASTPKAFANSSPGLERSNNPGCTSKKRAFTLKGFAADQNPFRVVTKFID